MRKLLQIGSASNCGAPGIISEQIGLLAKQQGWDVYIAHGARHANPTALQDITVTTKWQEHVHALYSYLGDAHGLASSNETKRLIKNIEEISPDIIHLHNIHGYFLNYKLLFEYLKTIEIPVVWTFHDFWPITGHCAHYLSANCYKWKTECGLCPLIKDYPTSLFVDHSKRNFLLKKKCFTSVKNLTIVPVSQWVASIIQESYLKMYPVKVIYNGVDQRLFKPTPSNLRSQHGIVNKFVLLGVAFPWSIRKGFKDYIKLRNCLSDDCVIVMIGLSPGQVKRLPDGIIGIERTQNQNELAAWYTTADVLLNLSYQETFGMTTVEAMACGTPSIVYNTTASPELVSEDTGFVIPPSDIDGIVNCVAKLRNMDVGTKERITKASIDRVSVFFNKDLQYQKYIDLYLNLMNK